MPGHAKRATQRRASRALFHAAAEHAPIGIYATTADGHCTYVNPHLCKLFGISRNRALGLGWTHCIHPDDHDRVWTLSRKAIGSSRPFELQYRIIVPPKKVIWVAASSSAFHDRLGNFMGRIGTIRDISAAKKAELRVRSEMQRIQRLLKESPRAITAIARPRKKDLTLTSRERHLLALVSQGNTNKEIAAKVSLSAKTVKNYLSAVFQKIHVKRRSEAAAFYAAHSQKLPDE